MNLRDAAKHGIDGKPASPGAIVSGMINREFEGTDFLRSRMGRAYSLALSNDFAGWILFEPHSAGDCVRFYETFEIRHPTYTNFMKEIGDDEGGIPRILATNRWRIQRRPGAPKPTVWETSMTLPAAQKAAAELVRSCVEESQRWWRELADVDALCRELDRAKEFDYLHLYAGAMLLAAFGRLDEAEKAFARYKEYFNTELPEVEQKDMRANFRKDESFFKKAIQKQRKGRAGR